MLTHLLLLSIREGSLEYPNAWLGIQLLVVPQRKSVAPLQPPKGSCSLGQERHHWWISSLAHKSLFSCRCKHPLTPCWCSGTKWKFSEGSSHVTWPYLQLSNLWSGEALLIFIDLDLPWKSCLVSLLHYCCFKRIIYLFIWRCYKRVMWCTGEVARTETAHMRTWEWESERERER